MGRNWAIAIGINQYDNLAPLHYAKRDAEAVRDYEKDPQFTKGKASQGARSPR